MIREALATLLDLEADLEVVASVGRGDEVLGALAAAKAAGNEVDVALLDIEMPGMDGICAAERAHAAYPGLRIVILTTFGRPGFLRRAMEAGASAFPVKNPPAAQLPDAIRRAGA